MRTDAGMVVIRPLREGDLDVADRVMRLAFGTFMGVPDPVAVFGDAECVRPRYRAEPKWAFVAELDGEVVGSNFAACWGSFGFFGPLTVRPDLWNRGIASRLMEPVMDLFERWGVRQAGLFTFADSPKHVALYRKFGFQPQRPTPLLASPVGSGGGGGEARIFSSAAAAERDEILGSCRELTDSIYEGLDVSHEIRAVEQQRLGETVLVDDDSGLAGFAVCHCGAGEAGTGTCFVKFAAARPGSGAHVRFERLLDAVESLAAARGAAVVIAGVNAAREDAHRRLLQRGFSPRMEGVIMQRPDEPGYCRPDAYVIDDLR